MTILDAIAIVNGGRGICSTHFWGHTGTVCDSSKVATILMHCTLGHNENESTSLTSNRGVGLIVSRNKRLGALENTPIAVKDIPLVEHEMIWTFRRCISGVSGGFFLS